MQRTFTDEFFSRLLTASMFNGDASGDRALDAGDRVGETGAFSADLPSVKLCYVSRSSS